MDSLPAPPPLPAWHRMVDTPPEPQYPPPNHNRLRLVRLLMLVLLLQFGILLALPRLRTLSPLAPPVSTTGKQLPSLTELVFSDPDSSKSGAQFVLNQAAFVNDTRRKADLNLLGSAIAEYLMETQGVLSFTITATPQDVGTAALNLKHYLVPHILESIPHDPLPQFNESVTGYTIHYNAQGQLVFTAESQQHPDQPIVYIR